MNTPIQPTQASQMRWLGTFTLFLLMAISFIDRINISMLITDTGFLEHMGLTLKDRAEQGFLTTAFLIGYGASAFILTPFCVVFWGVRKSLLIGLTLWGVVTFITPWLGNYHLVVLSRLFLGVAEGPLFAMASSYLKAHFESHENGKPNALVNMGTGFGLAIGFPLVGALMGNLQWHGSFYALGILNLIIGIPLVLAFIHMPKVMLYTEKPKNVGEAFGQIAHIVKGAFQTRNLLLLTLLTCAFLAYLWGSNTWLPTYLKEARGFSIKEMGFLASLPQYSLMLGVWVGGMVIDRLSRPNVPCIFLVGSLGVSVFILSAIYATNPHWAVACLTLANFCWGMMSPSFPSTTQYCSKPEHTASATGIINGTGNILAAFMPFIMGYVISWATSRDALEHASATAQSSSQAGFLAGFSLLIGTQCVLFVVGYVLWRKEKAFALQINTRQHAAGAEKLAAP